MSINATPKRALVTKDAALVLPLMACRICTVAKQPTRSGLVGYMLKWDDIKEQ